MVQCLGAIDFGEHGDTSDPYARVIVAGQERWHHDVINIRSDGRYMTLDLAAHPWRVHYWLDEQTLYLTLNWS